jgi:probable rRNA maturation factor
MAKKSDKRKKPASRARSSKAKKKKSPAATAPTRKSGKKAARPVPKGSRKTARKPVRRPSRGPEFVLSLTRREGAPSVPTAQGLVKLFKLAWEIIPQHRRPTPSATEGARRMAVDVLVVDNGEIAALNVAHLKVPGPTDVLSFPMGEYDPERKAYNLGEIVVSHEVAKRESDARTITLNEELGRYCLHGFLHLLGYEDATETQRQEMFAIQEQALAGAASAGSRH